MPPASDPGDCAPTVTVNPLSIRPRPPPQPVLWIAAALSLAAAAGAFAQSSPFQTYALPSRSEPEIPPLFGAISFTADGSFSSAWKRASKSQVEAQVLANCVKLQRGKCEVVSFREELCAALASGGGAGRRFSVTGGGLTPADAKKAAIERCNKRRRGRGDCVLRTVVCGDGRPTEAPQVQAPSAR